MFMDKKVTFIGLGKPPGTQGTARPDGGAASSSSGGSSSRRARQRGARGARAVPAAHLAGGREPDMGGGPGHISAGGRERPTSPRALDGGGAASPLRAELPGAGRPGRRGQARAPPASRRGPGWVPGRGEDPRDF